jgi:glycosyltransferase involved in cell wall biosynthesis
MPQSLISVIIPAHNRAHYLGETLESVFTQTAPPAEIIVIDDGSTDDTKTSLSSLINQGRIRYYYQEQAGVSAARNKGMDLAASPFIAFLDSDDIFLPTKLEKQISVFEKYPNLGFVHCFYSKFDDSGRDLGTRDTSRFSGIIYPSMLQEWSVLMAMPCMLARTEVIREIGTFDQNLVWAEDMDLWRRIARRYPVGVVNEVLVRVRVHPVSISHEHRGELFGFTDYLKKAFDDDPNLSSKFRRKTMALMYTNLGQNLLGSGNGEQMKQVRDMSGKALAQWPFGFGAIIAWLASFLPLAIRSTLVAIVRRNRYAPKAT